MIGFLVFFGITTWIGWDYISSEEIGNFAQLVSSVATIVAVFFAYIGVKQAAKDAADAIEQSNKTAQDALKNKKTDYFSEYSKRYNDLILKLPGNFKTIGSRNSGGGFMYDELADFNNHRYHTGFDGSKKHVPVIRGLFNLFSDEHYLYTDEEKVDKKIWNNWLEGMKMCLAYEAFQDVWLNIGSNSVYGDEYRNFIDNLISDIKDKKGHKNA
jgi:hypothetical protein